MARFTVLILAAVAVTANGHPTKTTNIFFAGESFIHGGETAEKGEFPHMVQLQRLSGGHYCGGSIITDEHVLTAAHCVTGDPLRVVAGQYKQDTDDGTEQERDIEEIIIHPKYGSAGYDYDIAVLRLKSKLDLGSESVQKIALFEENETPLGPAIVSGWGQDESGSSPNTLKKLNLTIYDDSVCENAYGDTYTKNMLCATGDFDNGGQCVCFGDSGSPAYIIQDGSPLQVGIVSWGNPCANAGYPAAYAEVGKFIDFIREHVPNL